MKASNDMEGAVDPWRTLDHVIDSYRGPYVVIGDDLRRGDRRTPGLLQDTGWQIRQDRVQDPASRAERAAETEARGKVTTGRKRRSGVRLRADRPPYEMSAMMHGKSKTGMSLLIDEFTPDWLTVRVAKFRRYKVS